MPTYEPPHYPPTLTNKGWQSAKGAIAKMAGETGIGDLLKKLEKAYDDVNWHHLRLMNHVPPTKTRKVQDIHQAYDQALEQKNNLMALEKACRAVEKAAKDLADKWAKDKLIPASSVKAIKGIEDAAKNLNYSTSFGTVRDVLVKDRDEHLENLAKSIEVRRVLILKLVKYMQEFEDKSAGLKLANYPAFWKENIRGPATFFGQIEESNNDFDKEIKVWRIYSNSLNVPASQEKVDEQITTLNKVVKLFRPKLVKLV